jgi:DNA-directed RNA polymerase specialized sigma24 family protein
MQREVPTVRAWEWLYTDHVGEVFGWAARRLGRDAGADLTVSVFAGAWLERIEFDAFRERPIVWLMRLSGSVARRGRRVEASRHRRVKARLEDPPDHLVPGGETPAELLDRNRTRALLRIDARDRDVLTLLTWTSLRRTELSSVVGLDDDEVARAIGRARHRLLDDTSPTGPLGVSPGVAQWLGSLWAEEATLDEQADERIRQRLGTLLRYEQDRVGERPFSTYALPEGLGDPGERRAG